MEHATRMARKHGFLLFFTFFGLVALIIYGFSPKTIKNTTPSGVDKITEEVFSEDVVDMEQYRRKIENVLITVPDTNIKISLVEGRASYGTTLDGGDVTFVKLVGGIKVNTKTSYIFADVAVQSGGTGVFHYVLLFDVTGDTITHLSSYFVGDRVELSSVGAVLKDAGSYIVKINYLDREPDQALVDDPTVPKEISVEVRNGIFVESTM